METSALLIFGHATGAETLQYERVAEEHAGIPHGQAGIVVQQLPHSRAGFLDPAGFVRGSSQRVQAGCVAGHACGTELQFG